MVAHQAWEVSGARLDLYLSSNAHTVFSWIPIIICHMTPVDTFFVGVLCQNVVWFSRVHWLQDIWRVNPSQFFAVCRETITRESALGTLRTIEIIPINIFSCLEGNNFKRVGPGDTKSHLVNPWPIFNWLQGNNIKIFVARSTKDHWVNPYQFILAVWKEII